MRNWAGNGATQRFQTAERRSGGGVGTGGGELRLKCRRQGLSFGTERWRRTIFASGGFQNRAHSRWTIVTNYQSESLASQSLDVLYREHEGLLRSIATYRYRICPSDAEALVHDIFASFLERQPEALDPKAFLIGSINNACKHYWRKREHEVPLLPHHELTPSDDEAAKLERWALRLSLASTLTRLGGKCSETLRRYYLRDESAESIAQELDTSAAYIWQLLSSCRKRARKIYQTITHSRS
jgi:RNA polymerase sigma factor (sigma-70 family)